MVSVLLQFRHNFANSNKLHRDRSAFICVILSSNFALTSFLASLDRSVFYSSGRCQVLFIDHCSLLIVLICVFPCLSVAKTLISDGWGWALPAAGKQTPTLILFYNSEFTKRISSFRSQYCKIITRTNCNIPVIKSVPYKSS